jgi:MFS transporter, DHA1 family, multidrug resistance protein
MPVAFLYLLGMLTAVAAVSTDLYLPALPAITQSLQTTPAQTQMTLSIFFLGYGFGQLVYGPLCDSFGRRNVLLSGLILYVIASIACALSPSIEQLLIARLVQALGGCAAAVIPRAIISDRSEGSDTAKALSTAMAVTIIGPLLAPTLGGLILLVAPWQSIFWVLTGYGIICTVSTLLWVDESLPKAKRQPFHLQGMITGYKQVFSNRSILLLLCCEITASLALFTFITNSAFVFINFYGLNPQQYGLVFSFVAAGLFISSIVNAKLVTRLGSIKTLLAGLTVSLTGAVMLIISIVFYPQNLPLFIASLWVCLAPTILIRANYVALGFNYLPERTGMVSAVFGAAGMGIGGVSAGLISATGTQNQIPMACMMVAGYILSALSFACWRRCS